jgi:DNA-binding beta-propeller fold protein YncE
MRIVLCACLAVTAVLAPNRASAQDGSGFRRVATIALRANGNTSFDISWVDPVSQKYYLADRYAKSIDVIDTKTNTVVTRIGGFVGESPKGPKHFGPSGVVAIPSLNQVWAGDGDSTVKVVDLRSRKIIDSISTGGTARADEIAYDARDQVIVIGNDADEPPFLTFVSARAGHKVLGHIPLSDATDGLEQPVWDRAAARFYVAVPATKTNPGGEIAAVDPKTMRITDVIPLESCGPHGLALGPAQNLLIGCRMKALILNLKSKSIMTILEAGGSDEVWFNPGDDKYFLASARTGLKIIDADTNTWIGSVQTGPGSHSVAADPVTNQVYVPVAANQKDPACLEGCIAVFADPAEQ